MPITGSDCQNSLSSDSAFVSSGVKVRTLAAAWYFCIHPSLLLLVQHGCTVIPPLFSSYTWMKASHGLLATFLASSHSVIKAQRPPFHGASAESQPAIASHHDPLEYRLMCSYFLLKRRNRNHESSAEPTQTVPNNCMHKLVSNHGQHQCGDSLVAPDIILLTAHCMHVVCRVEMNDTWRA